MSVNQKTVLIEDLDYLPDGILPLLSTPFPTLSTTTLPTDVEESIITQGILAHNINQILKTYEGLTPVELLLRIGQYNPSAQLIAGRGLKLRVDKILHDFEILSPEQDEIYYSEDEIQFSVQVTDGVSHVTSVTCLIVETNQLIGLDAIEIEGGYMKNTLLDPLPSSLPAQLEALFTVGYDDTLYSPQKSVTFWLYESP